MLHRDELDQHAAQASAGACSSILVLLEQWRSFVGEVADGYELTIYDFTNDLAIRDWLAAVEANASGPAGQELRSVLGPIDEQWEAVTRPGGPIDPDAVKRNGTTVSIMGIDAGSVTSWDGESPGETDDIVAELNRRLVLWREGLGLPADASDQRRG